MSFNSIDLELLGRPRRNRDGLLACSDWALMVDSPLSDLEKNEVKVYRQLLRDIPQTYSNITNIDQVVWPVKPECL